MAHDNTDWIEQQVAFRWFGADRGLRLLDSEVESRCKLVPRVAVLHGRAKRYAAVNGYNTLCAFNKDQQQFVLNAHRGKADGVRQTSFANLAVGWGLAGSFVTNWCDAAGWLYDEPPVSLGVPVLQYVRRRDQREHVVLLPIDRAYSGIGSANLPHDLSDRQFGEKLNMVAWRGRYCGTIADWHARNQFWAEDIFSRKFDAAPQATDKSSYVHVERMRVVSELAGQSWADVGLTLSPKERASVEGIDWKTSLLLPHARPRMPRQRLLEHKFILAIPGNDIASGIYWGLLSNSVVLMVENEWETALDAGLTPWVHYAPVAPTRDSIGSVFEKLLADPSLCEEIIRNAHEHMQPYLCAHWRDAADLLTLKRYQEVVIPVSGLDSQWSVSRA